MEDVVRHSLPLLSSTSALINEKKNEKATGLPHHLDCDNEAGFYIDKVSGGAGECAGRSTGIWY